MTSPRPFSLALLVCASAFLLAGLALRGHLPVVHAAPAPRPADSARTQPPPHSSPVLVELFTSEGCSSCPPADAVLAQLDRDQPVLAANIIVLSEHVDYWDGAGFRDRFSSPQATERQKSYRSYFRLPDIYTPQAVVNGAAEFNGADREDIQSAIARAALPTNAALQFRGVERHASGVTFSLAGLPTNAGPLDIYAALVDPEDTTEVHGGENRGRTLHHVAVVRTMRLVASSSSNNAPPDHSFLLRTTEAGVRDGMRLVVFAQTRHIGPVLGATSCVLAPVPASSAGPQTALQANRCPSPGI